MDAKAAKQVALASAGLAHLMDDIKAAAKKAELRITVRNISGQQKASLKWLGYEVSTRYDEHGAFHIISWE